VTVGEIGVEEQRSQALRGTTLGEVLPDHDTAPPESRLFRAQLLQNVLELALQRGELRRST
jgi:hypothetical protein